MAETTAPPHLYVGEKLKAKVLGVKTMYVPLFRRSNKKQIVVCASESGSQHVSEGEFPITDLTMAWGQVLDEYPTTGPLTSYLVLHSCVIPLLLPPHLDDLQVRCAQKSLQVAVFIPHYSMIGLVILYKCYLD